MIKGMLATYPEYGLQKAEKIAWSGHFHRWVKLLDSHPQIEMSFCGLTDTTDFGFLHDYDFVFLYVLPVAKPVSAPYWWYELPELIKPYCKKLLLQFDYEGVMTELPPFIEQMINTKVDALLYNSPLPETRWNVTVPKYRSMIKQPVEELTKKIGKQCPPKQCWNEDNQQCIEKDQTVGILWHAGTGCKIDRSLHLSSYLRHPTKVFSAWLGMKKEFMEGYVQNAVQEFYNPETWKCYPFMEYNNYIKELNKCYLVLEDNEDYYGFSRVAYECSALKIPVVGSTNNLACLLAYPYTTTNPLNVQLQIQLCKRLFEDTTFYDKVINHAYTTMQYYMSHEQCLNRFCKILKDLKVL